MNITMPFSQRGMSFSGFILGAFLLVVFSITGLKVVPVFIQDVTINKIFSTIARDPEMQSASLREIRESFDKRAGIDDITVINSRDIDIVVGDGAPMLSATYAVKVPLVANVSLYIEFNPTSAKK